MKNISTHSFRLKNIIILTLSIFIALNSFSQSKDSKGIEFWICIPGNQNSVDPQLYITSEQSSTVTIDIPGIGFNQAINVPASGFQSITIPGTVQIQSQFLVENKGIHITATNEVTIYAMNAETATTDAYLAFPLNTLGNEYYIMGYYRDFTYALPTQATIVATENNTTVTITTTVTDGGFIVGVPSNITLQQGEVYQLRSINTNADYTGTKITSDKPIGVYGGAQCTNISGTLRACDHLVEQLPPLNSWGKSFVTIPLATRLAGDVFRFLAQKNGTEVSINGVVVTTLNEGQFYETILSSTSYNHITSNEPILVGQYSRSSEADNVTSDPFFALVPPDEQFLNSYIISAGTSNIPNNYVNIASPTSNIGTVEIDGVVINSGLWNPIPGTNFSGSKVPIPYGVHTITSTLPIGVLVYGFGLFDSYGYLGGQSFAPIAVVTSLELTPQTGTALINTEKCFDALVKDQNEAPLEGIRVDFTITGANPGSSGFAFTDVNGIAHFCYTGANEGTDNITASVGTINDAASFIWTNTCYVTVSAKKFYDLNADGLDNDNIPVQGWNISLTGTDENSVAVGPVTQTTDANGTTTFMSIAKGSYTISEGAQGNWINTTATSVGLTVNDCINPVQVKFGNVCIGAGSTTTGTFGTGFWTNKNGQSQITGSYLCQLNTLCLRDATGSDFDPVVNCPSPTNSQINAGKTNLKNWLANATATNMSYMLSAHLASMKLNVLKGIIDGTKLIYAPGTSSANAAGFASVNAVMMEANVMLCSNAVIDANSVVRSRAESVKNALENGNNNNNFIQSQPCNFLQPAVVHKNQGALTNEVVNNDLEIKANPNPTRSFFNVEVKSSNINSEMTLRIFNSDGQLLEVTNNLRYGQILQVGNNLKAGSYLIEVIQGNQRKTLKVIKQ
jgi:hypothetical protein